MCVYIYIYIYSCIHICMHDCAYIYIYIYTHTSPQDLTVSPLSASGSPTGGFGDQQPTRGAGNYIVSCYVMLYDSFYIYLYMYICI